MTPLTLRTLKSLCSSRTAEGLQLEFKRKEDPATPELSKGDKRSIAEAVSAFANSDGGILIYGVRSEKAGDLDVAASLIPIADVEMFKVGFDLVCALNISPQISSVTSWVVYEGRGKRSGYLVCEVPASPQRPHMSTAPGVHSYYRRSFTGSALMTPSEIRDQILAVREARIEPVVSIADGGTVSNMGDWVALQVPISFSLRNIGDRTCMNPFMRVNADQPMRSNSAYHDPRLKAWKVNTPPGTILHVDDEMQFFSLKLVARALLRDMRLPTTAHPRDLLAAVRIYAGDDDIHARTITDKVDISALNLVVTYGAENANAQVRNMSLSRDAVARGILVNLSSTIRDIAIAAVGVWRQDLIDRLAAEAN